MIYLGKCGIMCVCVRVGHKNIKRLTEKSMFFLSWLTARGSGTGSVCFSTDTDSPVRIDWSTLRVVERMEASLMSAGTLSPTVVTKKKGPSVVSISDTSSNILSDIRYWQPNKIYCLSVHSKSPTISDYMHIYIFI